MDLLYACFVWMAHHAILGYAWAGQASPSALKVGIVDLDRALKESTSGKQALATLKQFRDKVVKEINDKKRQKDAKERTLRDLQTELTSQSMVLSDLPSVIKKRAIADKSVICASSSKTRIVSSRNLSVICASARLKLTSRLLRNLIEIIRAVGREESFTIIFERNDRVLLFVADAIDLTEKIIKRFDTSGKAVTHACCHEADDGEWRLHTCPMGCHLGPGSGIRTHEHTLGIR